MKINVNNTKALKDAIAQAEGHATARTITAEDIQREVDEIAGDLSKMLLQKDQIGAAVGVDVNAQTFPSAYQYTPHSTQFRIERYPSGWFLTGVERGCTASPLNRRKLILSAEQREKMAEFVIRNF